MSSHRIADAGARQVLLERFNAMDGNHVYVLTADGECPLLPVYQSGAVMIH